MIHYALRCGRGHGFDGWFRSSVAFEGQAADGSLSCPSCADRAIRRAPMAPTIGRRRGTRDGEGPPAAASPAGRVMPASPAGGVMPAFPAGGVMPSAGEAMPSAPAGEAMPDGVRALLQRMRAEVERRCDYVGPAFAETVRAIHQGEAPAREVYGEASADEAAALREEGIGIALLPWVKRADA